MENPNDNLCGCSPQKLASRSTEENLQECRFCGILISCPYPQTAMLKMAKDAIEETEETNLQDIARHSITFGDFHEKVTQKQNRLSPATRKKNLQQIARESITFSDYHEKAQDV